MHWMTGLSRSILWSWCSFGKTHAYLFWKATLRLCRMTLPPGIVDRTVAFKLPGYRLPQQSYQKETTSSLPLLPVRLRHELRKLPAPVGIDGWRQHAELAR